MDNLYVYGNKNTHYVTPINFDYINVNDRFAFAKTVIFTYYTNSKTTTIYSI